MAIGKKLLIADGEQIGRRGRPKQSKHGGPGFPLDKLVTGWASITASFAEAAVEGPKYIRRVFDDHDEQEQVSS